MTRKSYAALQRDLLECQQMIATLSTHPDLNVTLRAAVPFALRHLTDIPRFIVLVHFEHGPLDPQRVKRALHVRHAGSLMVGHWEGPTFLVALSGDPDGFIDRLYPVLKNEGLQATTASVPYTGDIERDMRNAQAIAQAHREGYPL